MKKAHPVIRSQPQTQRLLVVDDDQAIFMILYLLMRDADRPLTSEYLLRRVWRLEEVVEDALRINVHRLRKKIGANPAGLPYIVTERGVGYASCSRGSAQTIMTSAIPPVQEGAYER